tara:strand:- start:14 stop:613 length:600 start_codon:yes stop_codon:yes gene_type:complete
MITQKQAHTNTFAKVQLPPRTHFFIGSYLFLISLGIETLLSGFITDASPFSFLTVDLLELCIFIGTGLGVLFTITALFWGHRRHVRADGRSFWNGDSKKMASLLILWILLLYLLAYYLLQRGTEYYIIPTILLGYALLIAVLNFSRLRALTLFSLLTFFLGCLSLFITGIGFKCLLLLGIAQLLLGVALRKTATRRTAS